MHVYVHEYICAHMCLCMHVETEDYLRNTDHLLSLK